MVNDVTPVGHTIHREDWLHRKWRPMMGWTYMITCIFDFIVAPILWSIVQAYFKGNVTEAWSPITLQGAGLYHVAMGAILGVTAWKRSEEKMQQYVPRQPLQQIKRIEEENNG